MRMALAEGARWRRVAVARLVCVLECDVALCAVVDLCVVELFFVVAEGDFFFVVALAEECVCVVDDPEESDDCAATGAVGIHAARSPARIETGTAAVTRGARNFIVPLYADFDSRFAS